MFGSNLRPITNLDKDPTADMATVPGNISPSQQNTALEPIKVIFIIIYNTGY